MLKLWDWSLLVDLATNSNSASRSEETAFFCSQDVRNLGRTVGSFCGLFVTIRVISPYLSLCIGKTCFVSLNPFGKCFYKDYFTLGSTLLFKWNLIQLGLDSGAGQTKSATYFPPSFSLQGSNRETQEWGRAKEAGFACPGFRECVVAFTLCT